MNTPDDFDWLDKVLSGDGGHIDDNGFSTNVLRCLPPRRHRLRAAIFAIATVLSVAALLWSLPNPSALPAQLAAFMSSQSLFTLSLLSAALCVVASLLTVWLLNLDK